MHKLTVAVLFGGQSDEHEVSLTSAQSVMAALDPAKYCVWPMGITREGRWITGPDALAQLIAAADPSRLPTGQTHLPSVDAPDLVHTVTFNPRSFELRSLFTGIDLVFPVLHGPMGEDGTIQGLLELAGLPYVGCGVAASAVGMDKALMRAAFAAVGLPLLPWLLIRRLDWQRDPESVYDRVEAKLSYPVFVKPANMGSSVGISRAQNRSELANAFSEATRYDRRIVVEQGIVAREIEVSVLGNDDPETSVPGEIVPSGDWYDYAAKYLSGQSELIIPAPISTDLTAQVRAIARQAFLAVDASGLARIDFLLDREHNQLWLNEINTLPGFTAISMYAKLWAATGLEYSALVDRLIELALEQR